MKRVKIWWKKKQFIAVVSIIQHRMYVSILNLDFGMICQMYSNTDKPLSKQRPQSDDGAGT